MEMLAKRRIIFTSIFLILFLSSCQFGGGEDIVGRWEFGDQDFGIAFEFYDDGTGAHYNSIDPFYPLVGVFTYTYDAKSGVIKASTKTTTSDNATFERTIIYLVTFESKNEISLEQSGLKKPFQCFRKPLFELPPEARARIGAMLLGKNFEFIDAELLESGWEDKYENYMAIAKTDIEMTIGEDAEQWLVTLQVEGEDNQTLYVLRKGEERWGAMQLVRDE